MGQSSSENAVAVSNLQSKLSQAQQIISEKSKCIMTNEADIDDLKTKLEQQVRANFILFITAAVFVLYHQT